MVIFFFHSYVSLPEGKSPEALIHPQQFRTRSFFDAPGYIIHPSLFDGTIHAVCATMFDQDPPFLKIFAGVGKVTVVTKEAASGWGLKTWIEDVDFFYSKWIETGL